MLGVLKFFLIFPCILIEKLNKKIVLLRMVRVMATDFRGGNSGFIGVSPGSIGVTPVPRIIGLTNTQIGVTPPYVCQPIVRLKQTTSQQLHAPVISAKAEIQW